jgi:hypothetical protein
MTDHPYPTLLLLPFSGALVLCVSNFFRLCRGQLREPGTGCKGRIIGELVGGDVVPPVA